jgi:hypothetical protein
MTRLLSRITALTVFFGLLIGTARLFPTLPPNLTAFHNLLDDACDRPCLLGVELETMTIVDAMDRLRAHPWVGTVLQGSVNFFDSNVTIYWTWSGDQPDFIDGHIPGQMFGWTESGDRPHIVTGLEFMTTLRLYDLEQALGSTTDGLVLYLSQSDTIHYVLSYHDDSTLTRLTLRAEVPCPFHLMTYWQAPAILHYSSGRMLTDSVPVTNLRSYCQVMG